MDDLVLSEDVGRGNTSPGGAYIEGFGEFHEIYAGSVLAP